jgi:hypothetical protein
MTPFAVFMSGWGWAIFSIVSALFSAVFYLVNQYLRQPGHLLVFWMRVLIVLFMSPLTPHLTLPQDPRFYLTVAVTVFIGTFADIRTFNACSAYGGGVVSRVQPMTVWGAFIIWFFFDPSLPEKYLAQPVNTAGILAALSGCVWFAMRLNRCVITRAAFMYMLPALLGYTLTNVLNKYAMARGPLEGAVYGYMYVQSAIATLSIGLYALLHEGNRDRLRQRRRKKEKAAALALPAPAVQDLAAGDIAPAGKPLKTEGRQLAMAAVLAALAWICMMIYKNYAMAFTPNPSYQVALSLTAPVFVAGFYRLLRHKEEADVASGMGIVACAVLLAVLTVH